MDTTLKPTSLDFPTGAAPSAPAWGDPRTLPVYELYRRFRSVILSASATGEASPVRLASQMLQALLDGPSELPNAIRGGRIYSVHDDRLELIEKLGDAGPAPLGFTVPADYPVVRDVLRNGWGLVDRSDPRLDSALEMQVDDGSYGLIVIGSTTQVVLSLGLREPLSADELPYVLAALRSIAETSYRKVELTELIHEAKRVQTALLPALPTVPEGFEIACRMRPSEIVGGDIYDVLELRSGTFGLAVADATGHGLPAALLARDAIIGLRMGLEQELKSVATIERLGRVLVRSSPPGRFISLFYAEVDPLGHLIYVNAGHLPPLVVRHGSSVVHALGSTGPVLGVDLPNAKWHRGFDRLEPGDLMVLYTDGITEASNRAGEELGQRRLLDLVGRLRGEPVALIAEALLSAVEEWRDGGPQDDDQTIVVLRRTLPSEPNGVSGSD